MQSYKKTQEDNSFPALWERLTVEQRDNVRQVLLADAGVVESTIYRWRKNHAAPKNILQRRIVVDTVNATLGKSLTFSELFPAR
jgi:hypothetical protein